MSKYAVIEVGSRQERVVEGDILEVPKSFSLESMNPILLSPCLLYTSDAADE